MKNHDCLEYFEGFAMDRQGLSKIELTGVCSVCKIAKVVTFLFSSIRDFESLKVDFEYDSKDDKNRIS